MITVGEILATIDTKVKEHTDIIQEVDMEFSRYKGMPSADSNVRMQAAQKQMVLKDKILFHKAAILVLNDLKESING